jgi:hydrogenase nickel incorporation protein HypA/HybF
MHELSIAMSILDLAQEESAKRDGAAVEAIHLQLGALSGVVPAALVSAYELAREQTPLAKCRLVIEDVPVTIFCPQCQAERPVRSQQWFCCAECGAPASEVVRGRELLVTALELTQ